MPDRTPTGDPREAPAACWLCGGLGGIAVHQEWSGRRGKPLWTAHAPTSRSHPVYPCPACPKPTGDLRERLAQEIHLHCPSRPYGGNCRCAALADAVLPVVEAETAALRQRAEDLAAELRAVKIDRDEWRNRAEAWRTAALDQPEETR